MTRSEYMRHAFEAFNSGRVDEETFDAMLENIDVFCDEEDSDKRLPESYAEIEYASEDFESNPEAIDGARWDDMNYRHYMER